MDDIYQSYEKAQKRLFLLDYDGTLVGFKPTPPEARPGKRLLSLLSKLAYDPKNTIVIISGRDTKTLEQWLGHTPLHLVAEHGFFTKQAGKSWKKSATLKEGWKKPVREKMQTSVKAVAGSFIEEKASALVWHYRRADSVPALAQAALLIERLRPLADTYKLAIVPGQKIVEAKPEQIDKGMAAKTFLKGKKYDFMIAAGDDTTDEDLFDTLPDSAYSIKVGTGASSARFHLATPAALNNLLEKLAGR
jgi:trehalose 6-phosphate synthase/phosphatase